MRARPTVSWCPRPTPGTFNDFVDSVVPELQRRGLFRTDYTGNTLRDHLGLGAASAATVGGGPASRPSARPLQSAS